MSHFPSSNSSDSLTSSSALQRLQDENGHLRSQLADLRRREKLEGIYDRLRAGEIHAAYSSPLLQSYKNKSRLLELVYSNNRGDPSLILSVTIYLFQTLTVQQFLRLFRSNFLSALQLFLLHNERLAAQDPKALEGLVNVYVEMGREDEAAMTLVKTAYTERDSAARIKQLHAAAHLLNSFLQKAKSPAANSSNHFLFGPPSIFQISHAEFLLKQVSDNILLLSRQVAMENMDEKMNKKNKAEQPAKGGAETKPNRISVVGSSVVDTLYYSYVLDSRHPTLPSPSNPTAEELSNMQLNSPAILRRVFSIHERVFTWCSLLSLSRLHDFDSCSKLITPKSFFSAAKSPIGFEPFLTMGMKENAPQEYIEMIFNCIQEKEEKWKCILKFQLYELGIQLIKENKWAEKINSLADNIVQKLGENSERSVKLRQTLNSLLAEPSMAKMLKQQK